MMKLLIVSVHYHTPQNRVSDIIIHVTLNSMNGVENLNWDDSFNTKAFK
jgi:hypothetical protein